MCNVLIVEDELLIALDMELALEEAGCTVLGIAATVGEAVAIAERQAPDVMVVDLRLADGSRGPDAVERVREGGDVKVIFASGNLDPQTCARLERFDPVAMIPKPFTSQQIVEAVARLA